MSNNKFTDADKASLNLRVDEINAMALAENLADLRQEYDTRLIALENDIASLKHLIQSQSTVIGMALQNVMGNGSTVIDPHPEDKR